MAETTVAPDGLQESNKVVAYELSGVTVTRVPFTIPHFESGKTVPADQFHAESAAKLPMRLTMKFQGSNFKVEPLGPMTAESATELTGVVPCKYKSALCSIAPASLDSAFSYELAMVAAPADATPETVNELAGVKLITWSTCQSSITTFHFDAMNGGDKPMEVTVHVEGKISQSHPSELPFKRVVQPGERVVLGKVETDENIKYEWKCTELDENGNAIPDTSVSVSEMDGIKLVKTMTAGNPATLDFDVHNPHAFAITVSVDVEGVDRPDGVEQIGSLSGEVASNVHVHGAGDRRDWEYGPCNVFAGQSTAKLGSVRCHGKLAINWRYAQLDAAAPKT